MTPCIQLEQLHLRQGRKAAVSDLSLEIPFGSVAALLGRNGAGKSTLMDHLIGLLPAQSGKTRVLGLDPWRNGARLRAQIGYVEADPWFDPGERIGPLLRFFAAQHPGWSRDEEKRLIERFALDPRLRVRDLSRGMRTKLALVLALAHQPRLLILDEPFDGLDCAARDEILAELIGQIDEARCILMASHDIDEIERVVDRVVFLREGRLVHSALVESLDEQVQNFRLRARDGLKPELIQDLQAWKQDGDTWQLTFVSKSPVDPGLIDGVEDVQPLPRGDLKETFLAMTASPSKEQSS